MRRVYVDASALTRLAVREAESDALAAAIARVDTVLTSVVGRVEVERAVRRSGVDQPERRLSEALDGVQVIPMHAAIAGLAGAIGPLQLRTLDAFHLATIMSIRDDVDAAYVYDVRLADAMTALGITVQAPT